MLERGKAGFQMDSRQQLARMFSAEEGMVHSLSVLSYGVSEYGFGLFQEFHILNFVRI
jgi:hypothetical protein